MYIIDVGAREYLARWVYFTYVVMDVVVFFGFEVFENIVGGFVGMFLVLFDWCVSGFGCCLLCRWVCCFLISALVIRVR